MSTHDIGSDRWLQEREARFAALEEVLRDGPPPSFSGAEIDADVAEAIAAVRAKRQAEPPDAL